MGKPESDLGCAHGNGNGPSLSFKRGAHVCGAGVVFTNSPWVTGAAQGKQAGFENPGLGE